MKREPKDIKELADKDRTKHKMTDVKVFLANGQWETASVPQWLSSHIHELAVLQITKSAEAEGAKRAVKAIAYTSIVFCVLSVTLLAAGDGADLVRPASAVLTSYVIIAAFLLGRYKAKNSPKRKDK